MKIKRIISILILGLGIVISYNLYNNFYKEEKKTVLENKSFQSDKTLPMALMVETNIDSNIYKPWELDNWPGTGYTFNEEKSGCENGGTLEWTGNSVLLKVNTSDKCYAFFDAPLRISTIEDLVNLSNNVNAGKTYENEYIVLTKNLDFKNPNDYEDSTRINYGDINKNGDGNEGLLKELTTGSGFVSIGNAGKPFKGNFDGLNNTIKNIHISINTEEVLHLGLFGETNKAIIKNLKVYGAMETTPASVIGGIAGVITDTKIENCHNSVTITSKASSNSVGGIVGEALGTSIILNSTNNSSISGSNNAGGIVGYNNGNLTIDKSNNNGDITNHLGQHLGGILGRDNAATNITNIINSNNYGTLTVNSERQTGSVFIGGLVGLVSGTLNIQNSNNENSSKTMELELKGEVYSYMGGLIGFGDGAKITIDNAKNEQNLKITNNSIKELKIGGILSYIRNDGSLETNNVQNIGDMEINDKNNQRPYIGGIIGLINNNSIAMINKTSNISKEIRFNSNNNEITFLTIGGIVGTLDNNSTAKIIDSYNTTNVYGGTKLGGIVAYNNAESKVLIDKCYNTGIFETNDNASSGDINIGGLVGYNAYGSTSYILNSYNMGNLKNNVDLTNVFIGGLIGNIYADNIYGSTYNYIINSYNLGNIEGTSNFASGIFNNIQTKSNVVNELYVNNVYNAGNLVGTTKYGLGQLSNSASYTINNAYYLQENEITGSNISSVGEAKDDNGIKNLINTLNSNRTEITLTNLENDFPDYKVSYNNWVKGTDGYPVLEYK